jgi:hypothetical protein
MNVQTKVKLGIAAGLFCLAGLILLATRPASSGDSDLGYFYDLNAKKLFTAPKTTIPPFRGPSGQEDSAVRAIVVTDTDDPHDKAHQHIVYLEKFSSDLKAQMELVRSGQSADAPPRELRKNFILVSRVDAASWHSISSDEGHRIMTEWMKPGANGKVPLVCAP